MKSIKTIQSNNNNYYIFKIQKLKALDIKKLNFD